MSERLRIKIEVELDGVKYATTHNITEAASGAKTLAEWIDTTKETLLRKMKSEGAPA